MNQPDQTNVQQDTITTSLPDKKLEATVDHQKNKHREWFPEDDDEWYEPDYSRAERRS
ncbi:MAG TPA: hypothetical protein V6D22_22575 [Candidatus Obscuribacterales bacterium]